LHDAELLVGARQQLEKFQQVIHARNAIVFATHDEAGRFDLQGVNQGEFGAHVHIGASGHGGVQREDGVSESVLGGLVRAGGVIPIEDAVHKGAVDGPTVLGQKFRQFFLSFSQRGTALTGPDKGVQCQLADTFRMTLCKQCGFECTR